MFLVTEQQNMSVARSLSVCFRRGTVKSDDSRTDRLAHLASQVNIVLTPRRSLAGPLCASSRGLVQPLETRLGPSMRGPRCRSEGEQSADLGKSDGADLLDPREHRGGRSRIAIEDTPPSACLDHHDTIAWVTRRGVRRRSAGVRLQRRSSRSRRGRRSEYCRRLATILPSRTGRTASVLTPRGPSGQLAIASGAFSVIAVVSTIAATRTTAIRGLRSS
jgi:hypothetical protein